MFPLPSTPLASVLGLSFTVIGVGLALTVVKTAQTNPSGLRAALLRALALMDQSLTVERFVYRHHQGFGVLISSGAAYLLASSSQASMASSPALLALQYGVVSLSTLLVAIGAIVFVRPSVLKPVERWANRNVATLSTSYQSLRFCALLLMAAGGLLLLLR